MIRAEVLRAMLAAGATAEMLVAAVEADQAVDAAIADGRLAKQREDTAARVRKHREAKRNECNALQAVTDVTEAEQKEGPQTPKKNYPPSESSAGANEKPSKRKKPKGELCPEDFQPSESHRAKCRASGVPETVSDDVCRKMRNWSHANADRDVAWKANWSLALHGMLDEEIEKRLRQQARVAPSASSPQQRAFDRARQAHLELTEDRNDQDPSDAGGTGHFGAGRPANGHAGAGVHEPLGGRLGLAPPLPTFPPRAH